MISGGQKGLLKRAIRNINQIEDTFDLNNIKPLCIFSQSWKTRLKKKKKKKEKLWQYNNEKQSLKISKTYIDG